ncbi:hypothetical protein JDV02_009498 [Purpureocillium takamizusanense]|nr:uncharacterized protein JDV02_009498 [Purpureocillium takamizusanense]UNI23694.1 hypothetical protein JDV02_009498 [Purpureocillium takamizusanense]
MQQSAMAPDDYFQASGDPGTTRDANHHKRAEVDSPAASSAGAEPPTKLNSGSSHRMQSTSTNVPPDSAPNAQRVPDAQSKIPPTTAKVPLKASSGSLNKNSKLPATKTKSSSVLKTAGSIPAPTLAAKAAEKQGHELDPSSSKRGLATARSHTRSSTAAGRAQALKLGGQGDTGFVKPKSKSPTKPVNISSSLIAPTASSASRGGNSRQSLSRQSSSPQNGGASVQHSARASLPAITSTHLGKLPVSAIGRPRPSVGPPPGRSSQVDPNVAKRPSHVDEGFLARMTRPTQASSYKTARKSPSSPPRRLKPRQAATANVVGQATSHGQANQDQARVTKNVATNSLSTAPSSSAADVKTQSASQIAAGQYIQDNDSSPVEVCHPAVAVADPAPAEHVSPIIQSGTADPNTAAFQEVTEPASVLERSSDVEVAREETVERDDIEVMLPETTEAGSELSVVVGPSPDSTQALVADLPTSNADDVSVPKVMATQAAGTLCVQAKNDMASPPPSKSPTLTESATRTEPNLDGEVGDNSTVGELPNEGAESPADAIAAGTGNIKQSVEA